MELRTFSNGQYTGRFMLHRNPAPGHPSAPASSPWLSPISPATPSGPARRTRPKRRQTESCCMACRACVCYWMGGRGSLASPGSRVNVHSREYQGVSTLGSVGCAFVVAPKGADRRLGDTELDISVEVRVVGRVHLRDQRLVARFEYQDVQVRRPEGVAVLGLEQAPHDRVRRDGVTGHSPSGTTSAPPRR